MRSPRKRRLHLPLTIWYFRVWLLQHLSYSRFWHLWQMVQKWQQGWSDPLRISFVSLLYVLEFQPWLLKQSVWLALKIQCIVSKRGITCGAAVWGVSAALHWHNLGIPSPRVNFHSNWVVCLRGESTLSCQHEERIEGVMGATSLSFVLVYIGWRDERGNKNIDLCYFILN